MKRFSKPILRVAIPLAIAFIIIRFEVPLAVLAQQRPALLPAAMIALVVGLLRPRARRWLIVTLCFGMGLLALRDTFHTASLPAAIDYVWVERLYPFGWGLIAVLACAAAYAEAFHPDSVWARRCYFGVAVLYFTAHGLLSILKAPDWRTPLMIATGLLAVVGIATARSAVAAETSIALQDADMRALADQKAQRQAVLAAREWRESP